jgi:RNase H-fold protein (predicted Holliday junction resolvase)
MILINNFYGIVNLRGLMIYMKTKKIDIVDVIARVVVGFPITWYSELESRSGRSVQLYVANVASDLWQVGVFFQDPPVSSTNKTDRQMFSVYKERLEYDITIQYWR